MKKNVIFALFQFVFLCLVSCETPMQSINQPLVINRFDTSQTGKPKLLLVGDSRVEQMPDGYFTDDWDVYNIGVGGTNSQFAAYAIYLQTMSFDTIIISSGINDYYDEISPGDTVTYLNIAIAWAKMRADNVYITTIPGVLNNGTSFSFKISKQAAQANLTIPIIAANNNVTCIPLAQTLCNSWFLKPEYTFDGIHYSTAGYEALRGLYQVYIQEESVCKE